MRGHLPKVLNLISSNALLDNGLYAVRQERTDARFAALLKREPILTAAFINAFANAGSEVRTEFFQRDRIGVRCIARLALQKAERRNNARPSEYPTQIDTTHIAPNVDSSSAGALARGRPSGTTAFRRQGVDAYVLSGRRVRAAAAFRVISKTLALTFWLSAFLSFAVNRS